jgi:hypothetical protein
VSEIRKWLPEMRLPAKLQSRAWAKFGASAARPWRLERREFSDSATARIVARSDRPDITPPIAYLCSDVVKRTDWSPPLPRPIIIPDVMKLGTLADDDATLKRT